MSEPGRGVATSSDGERIRMMFVGVFRRVSSVASGWLARGGRAKVRGERARARARTSAPSPGPRAVDGVWLDRPAGRAYVCPGSNNEHPIVQRLDILSPIPARDIDQWASFPARTRQPTHRAARLPHPSERPGAFTRNRGCNTTRGMTSTTCRATCVAATRAESRGGLVGGGRREHAGARVRRGARAGGGPGGARLGSARPGARWGASARGGPKSTGALLGDQEVRLDPIARVSARVALAARAGSAPRQKSRLDRASSSTRLFAHPSASRHRRVALGAPSRGVTSAGTRNTDRTMRTAPRCAPTGRDPRRHDRPEARAIEARQKRRPRSFKLTQPRRPTSFVTTG